MGRVRFKVSAGATRGEAGEAVADETTAVADETTAVADETTALGVVTPGVARARGASTEAGEEITTTATRSIAASGAAADRG